MIARLLRRNISAGQIAGYAAANLIGLVIVLCAMQFYRDITAVETAPDSFISADYLIIAKKVNGLGGTRPFSASEVEKLKSQSWAAEVGAFTAADFNVAASVSVGGGNSMSTTLFLEAIPDEFFDITPKGWHYTPGQGQTVPIVISKDYLTLYNFGYASSRGLPQLSEELISQVPIRLWLNGNGRQEWVEARIAGFSSRLNTIAVPAEFMDWANSTFASGAAQQPSRLIVKLRKAGDPDAMDYMRANGYEPAGDREASGKAAYFTGLVTAVVVATGALICLLAIFILILSIYLLLQKNRDKIHNLMLLGYTPRAIGAVYTRIVALVNCAVFLLAVAALLWASHSWSGTIARLGADGASVWPTLATGAAVALFITLAGALAINRKVLAAFRD